MNSDYSPELLSKFVRKIPLKEDDILLNLLVESVANIPLNTIEFGRLSITGLQYLLSCTYEKVIAFVTPEYEVFRYSAILAAMQASNCAYNIVIKQLPTLEQLEQIEQLGQLKNSVKVENKLITDHQKVVRELEPLVKLIDFRRIEEQILVNIIEPLGIIATEAILNVYNPDLNSTRGMIYAWDEKHADQNLQLRIKEKLYVHIIKTYCKVSELK
jgi:hypothetical protein